MLRYTIHVSDPGLAARLDWLVKASGARDLGEATSQAYGLLNMALHEHVQGGEVILRSADGTERAVNLSIQREADE